MNMMPTAQPTGRAPQIPSLKSTHQSVLARSLQRIRATTDPFERHRLSLTMDGLPGLLCDTNGMRGESGTFLTDTSTVTARTSGEDIGAYPYGDLLRFEDGSFEVAASVNVLEYLVVERQRKRG